MLRIWCNATSIKYVNNKVKVVLKLWTMECRYHLLLCAFFLSYYKPDNSIYQPFVRWEDIRFSPQVMYVQPGTINKQQFLLSPKRFTKHHLTYMCALLILNSYDCHPNPEHRNSHVESVVRQSNGQKLYYLLPVPSVRLGIIRTALA